MIVSPVNFSSAGIARLQAGIEHHVAGGYAPGAVGLVACGDVVESFVVGHADLGRSQPMRRDMIFRIASMTKPITAAAVLMLIEDGKLALDEPVDRLLPELADRRVLRSIDAELDDTVPAVRPITVRDLLTFQMGLGIVLAPPGTHPIQRKLEDLAIMGFGPPDPTTPFDNDEWMRRLGTLPLMAQPGTDWLYTAGSNVQGVLVARASGQSLGTFFEERIFDPLGMRDTAFHVPPDKITRFHSGIKLEGEALAVYDDAATGGWSRPPIFEAGDAGLVSTVDDYLIFARLLLDRGRHQDRTLLSQASIEAMTTNHLTDAQRAAGSLILAPPYGWGFGLAVAVERDAIGTNPGTIHWEGGLGTSWASDPTSGLTTILLTPRMFESPVMPPIHRDFLIAARQALA